MNRPLVILSLFALVLFTSAILEKPIACFQKTKITMETFKTTLESADINKVIDGAASLALQIPNVLETCGDKPLADQIRVELNPSCVKVLNKQAKLLVKMLKLIEQDQQKNQKIVMAYAVLFEKNYKTQVQKQCPFLAQTQILEVKNKGDCAEATYRFSLVVEKLEQDLAAGSFNDSLTDSGKLIEKLPYTLNECNQPHLAAIISKNFPPECLKSIGSFVRELASIQHHYTHIEWLKKHWKEFTVTASRLRATCPAISKL